MENIDSTNPLLEDYLENRLSPPEKESFEKDLRQNPALQEELNQYKSAYKALKIIRIESLSDELRNYASAKKRRSRLVLSSIAACLLILMLSVLSAISRYSDEALFRNYFQPYPPLYTTLRGETHDELSALHLGLKAYSAQNYDLAITYFQSLLPQDSTFADAQFYLANTLMAKGQPGQALTSLDAVSQSFPQVMWYRSLALIAEGKTREAEKLLVALSQNPEDDFYQKKAQLLLNDLDSPVRKFFFR
ncbi:MAG: tetratricopeptide repeat protein [Bacteroidia bacterium]